MPVDREHDGVCVSLVVFVVLNPGLVSYRALVAKSRRTRFFKNTRESTVFLSVPRALFTRLSRTPLAWRCPSLSDGGKSGIAQLLSTFWKALAVYVCASTPNCRPRAPVLLVGHTSPVAWRVHPKFWELFSTALLLCTAVQSVRPASSRPIFAADREWMMRPAPPFPNNDVTSAADSCTRTKERTRQIIGQHAVALEAFWPRRRSCDLDLPFCLFFQASPTDRLLAAYVMVFLHSQKSRQVVPALCARVCES